MEGFFAVVALLIVGWIALKIYAASRNKEIVTCGSCNNKMSLGHFKQKGECPRCGSNLYNRTGERIS